MKKIGMLILGVAFAISPLWCQRETTSQEAYTGRAIGSGGPPVESRLALISGLTATPQDEEVDQLATLLKEKGPDALRRAMEKLDVGRINPTGSVGNQVASRPEAASWLRHNHNARDCPQYAVVEL